VDAIESAYDKILLESLRARRRPKINLKGKWKKATESRLIKAVSSRFEAPSRNLIIKTATLFLVLGIWSFLNPTEEGPIYQVLHTPQLFDRLCTFSYYCSDINVSLGS
jgi:hypothetical protein